MDYKPTATDIAWAQNLVRIMKEGGTWGCPMSLQIYVFKKELKELWLTTGPDTPEAKDVFEKNKIVFAAACNYTVVDKRSEN